ncbi:Beta-ketoacyl synthase [Nitrospira japonica]|uniref:Beta-ketoacyl synthase n=1 Tax=Nitrospira japonica TaxID=1325564 RepID=A0A1W1I1G8_9BACT|nr:beta-ketoacyl-[acyl-carrier-protein] synthase family protein [Nitrospira japonica]SLM46832.1 Beta-ketoacyl synthase [Nitrospira japonica]
MMPPLAMTALATANPLGLGLQATWNALSESRHGLRPNDFLDVTVKTWIGRIAGIEEEPITGSFGAWDCRNNRLALLGMQQDGFERAVNAARQRYGSARVGVVLGTTTSGILETELAYRRRTADGKLPDVIRYRYQQNLFSVTEFVQRYLGLTGPAVSVSTACASSARVFASAARWIHAGLCDAVVVGGVDSLCLMTLYGFASLGLLSDEPCRPCDVARNGLSIGEAAGFALLERPGPAAADVVLLGYGESSDAYHMSTPQPEGQGAALAMEQALSRAGLQPSDIDYVNLHGTGTQANDRAEDEAVSRVFGRQTSCSSTKGATGHTLGAAGITEAIIVALALRHDRIPGTVNTEVLDPRLRARIELIGMRRSLRQAVSNSFGFGGCNCSLVFGKASS